ncbi:MAG: M48 family metallopeptidase [Pseudomonadales bacterium]
MFSPKPAAMVTLRSAALLVSAVLVYACATSPLGRNQLILFPDAEMTQMGVAAFQDIKTKTPVASSAKVNGYVTCVSENIIRALPNGQPSEWEIRVFDEDQANAFALPGRKIGVYTGLLDVAENQGQLATVIGHEVAHVLANHSNERVSTNFVTQSGLQLAQIAVGANTPMKQQLFGLLGVGAQYGVLLPFGRAQEAEADLVGLELMAEAGFDPRESVKLWQNMQAAAGGGGPPEFMSTHPSSQTRITELNARMGEYMQISTRARAAGRVPDCR